MASVNDRFDEVAELGGFREARPRRTGPGEGDGARDVRCGFMRLLDFERAAVLFRLLDKADRWGFGFRRSPWMRSVRFRGQQSPSYDERDALLPCLDIRLGRAFSRPRTTKGPGTGTW